MSHNKEAQQEIKAVLSKAIDSLSKNYAGSSLTDIFVLVDQDSGELSVYDDEENCVAKGIISSWAQLQCSEDPECPDSVYARDIRTVISQMDEEDAFSKLDIYTPFSINLADEDFIVSEELLLIEDDSVVRIESEFMERMDKEFDEFLDNLLKD